MMHESPRLHRSHLREPSALHCDCARAHRLHATSQEIRYSAHGNAHDLGCVGFEPGELVNVGREDDEDVRE